MPKFSAASEAKLRTLHPDLQRVLRRAIQSFDFTIVEGARSDEQCYINFGKGRTVPQCVAKGCPAKYAQPHLAKVTWLNHPLSSNHRAKADGYGHAVDLAPYPIDWNNLQRFMDQAKVVLAAAHAEGVKLRWGADWDQDGRPHEKGETDNPHFELLA